MGITIKQYLARCELERLIRNMAYGGILMTPQKEIKVISSIQSFVKSHPEIHDFFNGVKIKTYYASKEALAMDNPYAMRMESNEKEMSWRDIELLPLWIS